MPGLCIILARLHTFSRKAALLLLVNRIGGNRPTLLHGLQINDVSLHLLRNKAKHSFVTRKKEND